MTGRNSHQLGREIHEVCWSNPWDCIHMNTLYDDWKKQPPLGKKPPLSFLLESSSKHVWTTIRGDYTGNGDSSHWVRVDVSRCVVASVVTALHHIRIWFNLVVPVFTWKALNYCISIQFNLVVVKCSHHWCSNTSRYIYSDSVWGVTISCVVPTNRRPDMFGRWF